MNITAFQETVWQYYHAHGRHGLPWRLAEPDGSFDPYKILVSEIMLQQTQVPRVITKYEEFLYRFPGAQVLATASLGEVLRAWQGLGYNRRAKFLQQAAQKATGEWQGIFPEDVERLVRLPGVGPNTAAAVYAYSFNKPAVFIETNIRTVYIHHFFAGQTGVDDKKILALVEKTVDQENPREWYWALMDYGSFLKQTVGNLNKQSKSYARQSPLEGSRRQVRGRILKLLAARGMTNEEMEQALSDERLQAVLQDLLREGLIHSKDGVFML